MRGCQDAYRHQVYDQPRGKEAFEIVEREDDFFDVNPSGETPDFLPRCSHHSVLNEVRVMSNW
jgi:hypothetical protein